MKSLFYLQFKTIKNSIVELKRKPGMLVLYVLILLGLVVSLMSMRSPGNTDGVTLDPLWLKLIFGAFLLFFFYASVFKGLSKGSSFFDMCDVNFLFVSPINPKHILTYGLVQAAKQSFIAGLFILFQGATLSLFGMPPSSMSLFLAAFVTCLIIGELLSICIYTYTHTNTRNQMIVRILAFACLAPLVLSFVTHFLNTQNLSDSALFVAGSSAFNFIPIGGWTLQGLFALIDGNTSLMLLYFAGNLIVSALLVVLITFGKSDYYEDVLVATESNFAIKQAATEGNLNEMTASKRKIKVKASEIKGEGAKAFLSKHYLESFRNNLLKIFDSGSLTFFFLIAVLAFTMNDVEGDTGFYMVLGISLSIQCLTIGTSSGLKELFSPYIFLIPESSLSKIIWSNLETIIRGALESILGFVVAAFLFHASPSTVVVCILIRTLFAAFLVATNLLSTRIFKDVINQGLLMMFYLLFIIIVMLPGIVIGIILGAMTGSVPLGLVFLAVWELALSVLFFFLSKGVLDTCDMQVMPKNMKR